MLFSPTQDGTGPKSFCAKFFSKGTYNSDNYVYRLCKGVEKNHQVSGVQVGNGIYEPVDLLPFEVYAIWPDTFVMRKK